jgi:hypothetical protein
MIVQIQPKDYWYKLLLECDVDESHAVAVRHVSEMNDEHIKLGLRYHNTVYSQNELIIFEFEVLDFEKWFLLKIKHGL